MAYTWAQHKVLKYLCLSRCHQKAMAINSQGDKGTTTTMAVPVKTSADRTTTATMNGINSDVADDGINVTAEATIIKHTNLKEQSRASKDSYMTLPPTGHLTNT